MRKEFRAEWVRAGYSSVMGSAEVVRPPSAEWVRAYHLAPTDFAISDIERSRLKVALFSDLNDPFELLGLNLRERPARRIIRDHKDTVSSETGLLCFSANWTSPALWSHYADKHRGMCLGFDLRKDEAQQVDYQPKRLTDPLRDEAGRIVVSEKLRAKLLRTKCAEWQYEQEFRIFVPLKSALREDGLWFIPFGQNLRLREVILGPFCALRIADVIKLAARYPDVVVFKARLAFQHFAVVPDEQTVP